MIKNFKEYGILKDEMDEYEEFTILLINEYMKLIELPGFQYASKFYFNNNGNFVIEYLYQKSKGGIGYRESWKLTPEEYSDLENFINDPEVFRNAKKYNL